MTEIKLYYVTPWSVTIIYASFSLENWPYPPPNPNEGRNQLILSSVKQTNLTFVPKYDLRKAHKHVNYCELMSPIRVWLAYVAWWCDNNMIFTHTFICEYINRNTHMHTLCLWSCLAALSRLCVRCVSAWVQARAAQWFWVMGCRADGQGKQMRGKRNWLAL